jgi:hypothetical protein
MRSIGYEKCGSCGDLMGKAQEYDCGCIKCQERADVTGAIKKEFLCKYQTQPVTNRCGQLTTTIDFSV